MAFPGRRASAVRWTSIPGDGDAREVSAEIEAWLARQPAAADWEGVLGALRDGLLRAGLEPALSGDTLGREILAGLAEAEDLEGLGAALDRLAARVDALAAPREPAARAAPRPLAEIVAETRGAGLLRDRIRL